MTEPYFEKIKYEKDPVRVRKKFIETLQSNDFNISKTARELIPHLRQCGNGWQGFKKRGQKDYLTALGDP